jgi:hypothetical protein
MLRSCGHSTDPTAKPEPLQLALRPAHQLDMNKRTVTVGLVSVFNAGDAVVFCSWFALEMLMFAAKERRVPGSSDERSG